MATEKRSFGASEIFVTAKNMNFYDSETFVFS